MVPKERNNPIIDNGQPKGGSGVTATEGYHAVDSSEDDQVDKPDIFEGTVSPHQPTGEWAVEVQLARGALESIVTKNLSGDAIGTAMRRLPNTVEIAPVAEPRDPLCDATTILASRPSIPGVVEVGLEATRDQVAVAILHHNLHVCSTQIDWRSGLAYVDDATGIMHGVGLNEGVILDLIHQATPDLFHTADTEVQSSAEQSRLAALHALVDPHTFFEDTAIGHITDRAREGMGYEMRLETTTPQEQLMRQVATTTATCLGLRTMIQDDMVDGALNQHASFMRAYQIGQRQLVAGVLSQQPLESIFDRVDAVFGEETATRIKMFNTRTSTVQAGELLHALTTSRTQLYDEMLESYAQAVMERVDRDSFREAILFNQSTIGTMLRLFDIVIPGAADDFYSAFRLAIEGVPPDVDYRYFIETMKANMARRFGQNFPGTGMATYPVPMHVGQVMEHVIERPWEARAIARKLYLEHPNDQRYQTMLQVVDDKLFRPFLAHAVPSDTRVIETLIRASSAVGAEDVFARINTGLARIRSAYQIERYSQDRGFMRAIFNGFTSRIIYRAVDAAGYITTVAFNPLGSYHPSAVDARRVVFARALEAGMPTAVAERFVEDLVAEAESVHARLMLEN